MCPLVTSCFGLKPPDLRSLISALVIRNVEHAIDADNGDDDDDDAENKDKVVYVGR